MFRVVYQYKHHSACACLYKQFLLPLVVSLVTRKNKENRNKKAAWAEIS